MHDELSLVGLIPIAMAVGRFYYLSNPSGDQITLCDRVRVVLTISAICGVWIGAKVVFAVEFAPEVTFLGRLARGLPVVGIGFVPLLIVKLVDWGLHLKQRLRKPRR